MDATLSPARILVRLSIAGAKRARSALRGAGVGKHHAGWADRAAACARCPLSVVVCGKSYCGKPLLRQLDRDEPTQGCGCPIRLKAQDPAEHCPRTFRYEPSSKGDAATCDCVWCVAARSAAAAGA
jgi:hypothetical protein